MCKLVVAGGHRLKGEIAVEGSKNAVLPILAATILNAGINVINNCPRLRDVDLMIQILERVGCRVVIDGNTVIVDSTTITSSAIPVDLAKEMRSSIIIMGAMLVRAKEVTISYPGG